MQKLDLIDGIKRFSAQFNAARINERYGNLLNTLGSNPSNGWDGSNLVPLFVEAKSNFDSLFQNGPSELQTLAKHLNLNAVYATTDFSRMIGTLTGNKQAVSYLTIPNLLLAFSLNSELLILEKICETLLVSEQNVRDFRNAASDVMIFQISHVDSPLSLDELTKILKTLSELIENLALIFGQKPTSPEILLLDSGSPVSIGVKADPEKVSAILRLFKDAFDYVFFFKHFKNAKEMSSFSVVLQLKTPVWALSVRVLAVRKANDEQANAAAFQCRGQGQDPATASVGRQSDLGFVPGIQPATERVLQLAEAVL